MTPVGTVPYYRCGTGNNDTDDIWRESIYFLELILDSSSLWYGTVPYDTVRTIVYKLLFPS